MGNKGGLRLARQAVSELLKVRGVTEVVYVDDVFQKRHEIGKVIGWFANAYRKAPDETQALMPETPFDAEDNVWRQELRRRWVGLGTEEQTTKAIELSRILGTPLAEDTVAAQKLASVFPRKLTPSELSPSEWEDRKGEILARASDESRVLCLFDQDLSEAEGFASDGPRSGIGLLRDATENYADINIICGLLTHTISSLEGEEQVWRQLANENQLSLSRFLPLAKLRLDDKRPWLFADGIKKTMLNAYCEELKSTAIDILKQAQADAVQRLSDLNVYEFDHIILQSSHSEGAWEADTLMRVFHIFQQDAMRKLMLDPTISGSFNETVQNTRAISAVRTTDAEASGPSYPQVWSIRNRELYEERGLTVHSPLQVGDLFELTTDDEQPGTYILLAQPCDLMVRKDGLRSNDELLVTLVPVERRITYEVWQKKPANYWRTHAAVPYFYPDSNNMAVLAFAETCWVSVNVLDLAVLDDEGICKLDLNQEMAALPPQLTSSWRRRIEDLAERFRKHGSRLDEFGGHIDTIEDEKARRGIWQSVMPRMWSTEFGFPLEPYSEGVFDFGLRRIGRYRRPGADRLLKAYTRYLSRDAEEHDFASQL